MWILGLKGLKFKVDFKRKTGAFVTCEFLNCKGSRCCLPCLDSFFGSSL